MTFLEALRAAAIHHADQVLIQRENGPRFLVDHLGQLHMQNNCFYLGDVLDFDDWTIDVV